jgi:glutathione synthase/RimK-type ligase-like ATP-grasp enzyme
MPFTGIRTPPSQIPTENLRRAAAIARSLRPAGGSELSEEDQYQLANEMAKAMNGDALSVDIVEVGRGGEKEMRQVAEQGVQIGNLSQSYEQARTDRLAHEKRLVEIAEKQKSGQVLSTDEVRDRDTVLGQYRTAHMKESGFKENIAQAAAMGTKIIMHPKGDKAGK